MELETNILDDITSSPIDNFYNYLLKNLDELFTKFLEKEAINNKAEPKKIEEIKNEIQQNQTTLQTSLNECNIASSIFFVFIISPTFLILIGFLFLKPFKKYISNIKKYFLEKKKYKKIINSLDEKINNLQLIALGTFNLVDFLNYYFKSKGIRNFDVLSNDNIVTIFKQYNALNNTRNDIVANQDFIDIKGVECRIRNNPFYDVLVRKIEIKGVLTSKSESFSYQTTETRRDANGNNVVEYVTQYETLTATHNEPTPFVLSKNIGIYQTRFAPNLNFYTNAKKRGDIIRLENEEFSNSYKINNATNKVELNMFFTIKAQEDFLSWFLIQNKYLPFCKIENNIFIEMDDTNKNFSIKNNIIVNKILTSVKSSKNMESDYNHQFMESLFIPKKSISDFIVLDKNKKNPEMMRKELKLSIINYVNKFGSAAILPLLSPVISREAFRDDNNNYLISQSFNDESYRDKTKSNKQNFSKTRTIAKLCDNIFFSFLKLAPKRPMWLEIVNEQKIDDCLLIKFNLHSFWSQTKIDLVSVVGFHVGHKIISVPYEEFHKMYEEKEIICLPMQNNIKSKIVISRINQVSNTYSEEEIKNKYLLENNIWTNNPDDLLGNEILMTKFKELVSHFYTISSSLTSDAKQILKINNESSNIKGFSSLLIDSDGFYFIHNSNINKSLINEIKQLLTNLSKLNFI